MNIQPNSKESRKYLEVSEYFSLLRKQRMQSFIGEKLSIWADEALEKRINELEECEFKGLMFFGEKNWLYSYIKNGRSDDYNTYEKWVQENFTNFLGLSFKIDNNYPSGMEKTWKAALPATKYLLDFDELKNPAYQDIEELELFVGGNDTEPSSMHICALFDALHNLQYSIATLSRDTKDYEPLDITGIDVSNKIDPYRILINVISEYGSEFDKTIICGEAWRGG